MKRLKEKSDNLEKKPDKEISDREDGIKDVRKDECCTTSVISETRWLRDALAQQKRTEGDKNPTDAINRERYRAKAVEEELRTGLAELEKQSKMRGKYSKGGDYIGYLTENSPFSKDQTDEKER